jgi:Uma2 family endonuclease
MGTVPITSALVSVEEYLEGELRSAIKHDYLGGIVYAMAGASEPHNIIATNLCGILYSKLRGRKCQSFGSDMKFRINNLVGDTYFYYPDAMVACDPTDSGNPWRERPTVVFEIISEETRHVDEREKRMAYKHVKSVQAFVRIEQSRPEISIDRRTADGWINEVVKGLEATLRLPEIDVEIPFAEIFERLDFAAAKA